MPQHTRKAEERDSSSQEPAVPVVVVVVSPGCSRGHEAATAASGLAAQCVSAALVAACSRSAALPGEMAPPLQSDGNAVRQTSSAEQTVAPSISVGRKTDSRAPAMSGASRETISAWGATSSVVASKAGRRATRIERVVQESVAPAAALV